MVEKSLDRKLARIHADPHGARDFILADAKDADMALALGAPRPASRPVPPAARANDTTDIHIVRGGQYAGQPSLPFRTATLDHIQCGHLDCAAEERVRGVNLGLYSITFNNDAALDRAALEEY